MEKLHMTHLNQIIIVEWMVKNYSSSFTIESFSFHLISSYLTSSPFLSPWRAVSVKAVLPMAREGGPRQSEESCQKTARTSTLSRVSPQKSQGYTGNVTGFYNGEVIACSPSIMLTRLECPVKCTDLTLHELIFFSNPLVSRFEA